MKIGEKYNYAMKVTDREEAERHLDLLVLYHVQEVPTRTREEALKIERSNLGYYAGYFDAETRRRVEDLFECEHPIMGSIERDGEPTMKEAFEMGIRWAIESVEREGSESIRRLTRIDEEKEADGVQD